MTTTAAEKRDTLNHARERLQADNLQPGETVYTVMRHVSTSGMYRAIDLYVMRDGEPKRITWEAAQLLEGYDVKHEAAKASGAGMDMGFHLVYNLSRITFPNGFDCIGKPSADYPDYIEGCPSNDHSNREDNAHHEDGGYALIHRWL